MREIKFRIKYLGDDSLGIESMAIPPEWRCIDLPCELKGELYHKESSYDWDTFTQWTGLKDKNGKEIYEGDIVKLEPNNWPSGPLFEVIYLDESQDEFESGAFQLKASNKRGHVVTRFYKHPQGYNPYTVIGNIYENPELLEQT